MRDEWNPPFTLDDITGREWYTDTLRQCLRSPELDSFLLLEPCRAIALCGRPGCGKRTLAVGYAGYACANGMKCVLLSGRDLPEDLPVLRSEIRKRMQEAQGIPTVFLIEGCGREAVWEALSEELEEMEPDAAVCWVLIEDDERYMTSPWAADFLLLPVMPPDDLEREKFFAMDENRLMRRLDEKGEKRPSFAWLAEHTDGLTYRDLKQIILLMRLHLKGRAIREYGGDVNLLFEQGLRTGKFYYSEETFLEITERVRESAKRTSPGQIQLLQTVSAQPQDSAQESGKKPLPDTGAGQSEDELAMQDVLSMIQIKEH